MFFLFLSIRSASSGLSESLLQNLLLYQFWKSSGVAVHHLGVCHYFCLCWRWWQCSERQQMQKTARPQEAFVSVQTGWQLKKRSARERCLVCGAFINGLPYEDTSCESRSTQRDPSVLSEAHGDLWKKEKNWGRKNRNRWPGGRNRYGTECDVVTNKHEWMQIKGTETSHI